MLRLIRAPVVLITLVELPIGTRAGQRRFDPASAEARLSEQVVDACRVLECSPVSRGVVFTGHEPGGIQAIRANDCHGKDGR